MHVCCVHLFCIYLSDADQSPSKDNIVEIIINMLKKRGWTAKFPITCGGSREVLMDMKKLVNDPVSYCYCCYIYVVLLIGWFIEFYCEFGSA